MILNFLLLFIMNESVRPPPPPNPTFVLQNSKPVTCVEFSSSAGLDHVLYAGNRNGDLTIYNHKVRRSLFSSNVNSQAILSIVELPNESSNFLLTHTRNGFIYKWTRENDTSFRHECNFNHFNRIFTTQDGSF